MLPASDGGRRRTQPVGRRGSARLAARRATRAVQSAGVRSLAEGAGSLAEVYAETFPQTDRPIAKPPDDLGMGPARGQEGVNAGRRLAGCAGGVSSPRRRCTYSWPESSRLSSVIQEGGRGAVS